MKTLQEERQSKPTDQRIKVTLSAPRSSNSEQIQHNSEPILLESPAQSSIQNQRQSTTTLISASGLSNSTSQLGTEVELAAPIEPDQPAQTQQQISNNNDKHQQILTPSSSAFDRKLQEAQLRRIASQRITKRLPSRLHQLTTGGAEPNETKAKAKENQIVIERGKEREKGNQAQLELSQAASSSQPPSQANSKQLAIYINGKIRSNSIFCRSSSSNSFNSVLNRFHSNNDQAEAQNLSHLTDESGQFLYTNNNNKQQQQQETLIKKKNSIKCNNQQQQLARDLPLNLIRKIKNKSNDSSNGFSIFNEFKLNAKRLFNLSTTTNGNNSKKIILSNKTIEDTTNDEISKQNSSSCEFEKPITKSSQIIINESQKFLSNNNDKQRINSTNNSEGDHQLIETSKTSYKLNPSSMFLRKAMRYYRLWIYCANITIFFGTLMFFFATIYVLSDFRIKLLISNTRQLDRITHNTINNLDTSNNNNDISSKNTSNNVSSQSIIGGSNYKFQFGTYNNEEQTDSNSNWFPHEFKISYSEPSVILAYVAIAFQAGLLQAIGCFGAVRMKERWIQAFWYLILALTLFDVVFLLYWLNRYDTIVKSMRHQMTAKLHYHYGAHENLFTNEKNIDNLTKLIRTKGLMKPESLRISSDDIYKNEHINSELDKILTNIIDKIQSNSQCCGISNSLDYKQSRWRELKLEQYKNWLNWTNESQIDLLNRMPIVPASCCRIANKSQQQKKGQQEEKQTKLDDQMELPVILDDAQLGKAARVPAWSPSMVVDELPQWHQRRPTSFERRKQAKEDDTMDGNRAKLDDEHDDEELEERQDNDQEQILASDELESHISSSSKVDSVRRDEHGDLYYEQNYAELANGGSSWPSVQRNLLLGPQSKTSAGPKGRLLAKDAHYKTAPVSWTRRRRSMLIESTRVNEHQQVLSRFVEMLAPLKHSDQKQSNQLKLEPDGASSALKQLRAMLFWPPANKRDSDLPLDEASFKWPNEIQVNYKQYKVFEAYLLASNGSAHRKFDDEWTEKPEETRLRRRHLSEPAKSTTTTNNNNNNSKKAKSKEGSLAELAELAAVLEADSETNCAPRSYYDQATIYTKGCQPAIRAWLESSANVLLVTGFCILTVLKFCALVLLRLEIREMIHKIRVLKGMATEYNALHDLEAYLPRPSVCAQAAELTPSGVTAAVGAGGPSGVPLGPSGSLGAPTSVPHIPRLGGSFSEAVVAATAVAANQAGAAGVQLSVGGPRGGSCRTMLSPSMCPRSSSASASSAHLYGASGAALLATSKHQALSLRSDLFPSASPFGLAASMPRRHTAVSMCPAGAAAAIAAAAAQQLASRRGTYALAINQRPSIAAGSAGSNCSLHRQHQHRHSSHAVPALLASNSNQQASRHQSIEQQSSAESQSRPNQNTSSQRSSLASQQPLALLYPFKRQSSAGAHSACNFSLDLAPAESRRSIH